MKDILIDRPITRDALEEVTVPARAHGALTSLLPQLHGRSSAIRADTATVFRIDLSTDPLGVPGRIRWRIRSAALEAEIGTAVDVPELGEGMRIVVAVAAEKRTRNQAGKICAYPVGDSVAHEWASALLARNGLGVTDLAISPAQTYARPQPTAADRRRNRARAARRQEDTQATSDPRFTVRHLAATITITDPDLATRAMYLGIGRGRAYGLGLIVPLDPTDS